MAAAAVLPLEPQPLARRRQQWFEGWFFRFIDHATATSVAVIFGSMRGGIGHAADERAAGRSADWRAQPFDEHLLVLAYRDGGGADVMRSVLLDGPAVTIGGGGARAGGPRVEWWSERNGGMRIEGDAALVDVTLPGGVRVAANVSGPRVPWSEGARADRDGPEGWLARTGLLPCHYFVHSFGSPSSYALWRAGRARRPQRGRALAHVERNYGDAFPTGWVWGQAASAAADAFLVLTGGRFVIGPLTTYSYIIGLRAGALSWNFRTTDADRVVDVRRACEGALALNATSRDGRRRLELALAAPPATFGERIMVPTNRGYFSDKPGCRESYAATAHVAAWEREAGGKYALALRAAIPLAVLEFGGGFQC
jgi:hypothetical protein